ncbi:unnamed protein product [Symbiodinium pilosum]|uniref:Mannose-P-dolichol utilization defect 1 protein homolog n=1 Tax=Symbiodinium pilosum TaxID=2952 RepID=A0A812MNB4_SYMPI|nr:unnamed protein product [Symbiodinium pilosum]
MTVHESTVGRFDDFSLEIMLSKALSVAVIAGSCVGKMPQVMAVWNARSAQGLSKVSIWTEAVSMGVQLSYNIVRHTPITTYAEVAILFPQMLLLTLVVAWADSILGPRVWLACGCLCTGVVLMATGLVSSTVTAAAYAANALFGIVAVLPQVVINYRNKSTGQLSFLVTAMTFGGMGARLYTTFVEVDDVALRTTMLVNFTLVSTLMMQFAIYRDTRPLPPKPQEMDLEPESPVDSVHSPKPFKRQASMVQAFASFGSSRCLSEMVDVEMMENNVAVIKSRSSASLSQFARSLSWSEPPPASSSVPDLDTFDLRQASAPSPMLRRN